MCIVSRSSDEVRKMYDRFYSLGEARLPNFDLIYEIDQVSFYLGDSKAQVEDLLDVLGK